MNRTIARLLFAFSIFIFAGSTAAQQPTAPLVLTGTKGEVTVRRDHRAIPYIEAKNDNDLYFVQGYVTASDRLWQMDLMRRVALGETAEIFGKQTLAEDKRWRKYGFKKIAEANVQHVSTELKSALESYARGVNAYIASLDEKTIPVEFRILQYKPRPWTPADTIGIGKILADALSSTWQQDLLNAKLESLPREKVAQVRNQVTPYDVVLFGKDDARTTAANTLKQIPAVADNSELQRIIETEKAVRRSSLERVGLYADGLAASNNWVISGKRTSDGKPLLANDPHLLASAPGIWYLTHLSTPSMRVSGVTFPGVPGIVLGHNEHIAWGATNVGPDVQDLYLETFNTDGKYKTPTGTAESVIRKEEIRVRIDPLRTDISVETLDVVDTRNGPIIAGEGERKYALKWTAFDPKNSEFEAFFRANRAKDWKGFLDAFRNYGGPTQNFVYADVKGNIGWYAAGKIPIRRTGDGSLPYDGATTDGDWTGMIPFEELPHLYNPSDGLIITANQRLVGTSYKYPQISRDAAPPWRARRIYDLLKNNRKVTMDDVRDAQYDIFNIPLSNLAKEIVKLRAVSDDRHDILLKWDGRMTEDSTAALIANEFRICLSNKLALANRPITAAMIRDRILDEAIRERSELWLPDQFKDYVAFIRSCDADLDSTLAKKYGADKEKWTWGAVSKARFPHPLAVVPFIGGRFKTPEVPISGSGQTPNVASYVSMRHIASPGNWDATRHVIPLGQSGNPQSPHYKDQFESWRSGELQIFPFTNAAVKSAAKPALVFRGQ